MTISSGSYSTCSPRGLKDGAVAAAEGQAPGSDPARRIALANRLRSIAEEVSILTDAVIALAGEQSA
ncbi:hypothetical protein [Sphingomonas profundi]|uniref:hypothetical protein n=1 Tax=Alterirhizorhabdus profundi TaxID=2681549 RepID=UPI0012E7755F|nr:hypothetical protein [Sphingomonas profundi]